MAITNTETTSFKKSLLDGEMDFSDDTTDVFKIALYTDAADMGADTTTYTTTDEVVGTGYTPGGNTLTITTHPTASGTGVYLDFADTTWTSATITARGALIYKVAAGNPSVATLSFGENRISVAADFTINMPNADILTAIIRVI